MIAVIVECHSEFFKHKGTLLSARSFLFQEMLAFFSCAVLIRSQENVLHQWRTSSHTRRGGRERRRKNKLVSLPLLSQSVNTRPCSSHFLSLLAADRYHRLACLNYLSACTRMRTETTKFIAHANKFIERQISRRQKDRSDRRDNIRADGTFVAMKVDRFGQTIGSRERERRRSAMVSLFQLISLENISSCVCVDE